MTYKWNKLAEDVFLTAVEYTAMEYGKNIAEKFIDKVDSTVNLIAGHPIIGKIEWQLSHRKHEYRSLVVDEHYKLVYYINSKKLRIVIADMWDTRQNPFKLTRRLK